MSNKIYLDVAFKDNKTVSSLGASFEKFGNKKWYVFEGSNYKRFSRWLTGVRLSDFDSSPTRIYLTVPYEERHDVNLLGAVWDKAAGCWYADSQIYGKPFEKWLPQALTTVGGINGTPENSFLMFCQDMGLIMDDLPVMDGKKHRVPVDGDKKGQKSGQYAGYMDGIPAGNVRNYREDSSQNWVYKNVANNKDKSRLARIAQSQHNREIRALALASKHQHSAKRCRSVWDKLKPADADNSHLMRKKVECFGAKEDKKGRLVIPLVGMAGKINSLQRISGSGFKSIKKGSQKSGCFYMLNDHLLDESRVILYAEGFSTSASIAMAMNLPVVMTIDAGNMPAVFASLRDKYPDKISMACVDNDRFKEVNMGVKKGKEATANGGVLVVPQFPDDNDNLTDWNDLHCQHGLSAVKEQITQAIQGLSIDGSE